MKRRFISLLAAAGVGALAFGFQTAPPAKTSAEPAFLEGVVKGPDGKPVESALVLARVTNSPDPPDSARTDASGRFKIAARRSASHLVRVEAKGFAGRTLERVLPGKPLDVVLQKGGVIQGAVFDGRSAEPIAGARVEARSPDLGLTLAPLSDPSAGVVQATTDAKGRFRLENVPPGLHTVAADARGYGRAMRNAVPAGGSAELFLFPGASIAGQVRDAEDKPVAGAVVRAESDMPMRSGAARAEVTTAQGSYVIPGLEAGTYRLTVRHKDSAPVVVNDVVVRLESETTADVVLSSGGRVVGRLLDGDGKPLLRGRATVSELDGKPAARGLTDLLRAEADAQGTFRLASVPPGAHVLSLSAQGYATTRLDVTVRDGQETDAGDVALETGLAIRGSVRAKSGAPIPDATVSTLQPAAMPMFVAQTEADGTFTLAGVGAGRHPLRVIAPGYAEGRRQVDAGSEGVDFVLSPAGSVSGAVVDEAGRPVEAFRVTARGAPPTGPNQISSFQSRTFGSGDGRFSLDIAAEGPHVVEVVAPNHATATVSGVQVVLGQAVDVGRIRMSAGGTVQGVVVDSGGAAVSGATVTIRGAGRDLGGGGMGPQGTSDVAGSFSVRGVAAGSVEAVASHPNLAEGRASGIEVDPSKGPVETRIVMTRGGRIDGVVRRRDGSGIPGLSIMLWPTQAGPMLNFQPVVTGEDGTFTADHVRPGRARITLMAGTGGRFNSIQDREVDVREGEATSVEFVSREILLTGRVTRNGEPAPGLQLRLSGGTAFMASLFMGPLDSGGPRGPQRMMATTDADGRYEMIANESGKLRMSASSMDNRFSLPTRMLDVPDLDAHVVNLDFGGASVSGVVVDKDSGQPVADARIMATLKKPPPGSMGGSATTGSDGRFQIELEPGDYRIQARAQGYAPGLLEADVGSSGLADARITVARGFALEGKVLDERGRGVGGLSVFASVPLEPGPSDNRPPGSFGAASTNGDGSFVIEGLVQQPHIVSVRSNIGSFALHPSAAPGDKDVTLTLKPGGTLHALVVGPDGAPVAGASVVVQKVNGVRASSVGGASTDARGIAELQVPAGDLEVRAIKEKLNASATVSMAERGTGTLEFKLSEGPKPRLP